MQDLERAQDKAIDEELGKDSPYDKAIDQLPMDKPPLYVEQFVLDDTHDLVVRTDPRRFFCGRTREQRLAGGIDDFVLIVDGLRESGVVKPLARADGDKVRLTARGRGAGPC